MIASATAASRCVTGVVSAAGTVWRMAKPRRRWLARSKRRDSYSCPPNTLTTLWHSMVSSSTCARSPIECCASRAMLRSRRDSRRTNSAIGGPTAMAISVSFQLRYSIQPSRPMTRMASWIATVSTEVAAEVTPPTS